MYRRNLQEKPRIGGKVNDFYQELFSAEFFVFDEKEPYFQEKLLQVIWNEALVRTPLTTADGRKLQVVHADVINGVGDGAFDIALLPACRHRRLRRLCPAIT